MDVAQLCSLNSWIFVLVATRESRERCARISLWLLHTHTHTHTQIPLSNFLLFALPFQFFHFSDLLAAFAEI